MLPADTSAGSRPNSGSELKGASGCMLHKPVRLLCTPGETVCDPSSPMKLLMLHLAQRERDLATHLLTMSPGKHAQLAGLKQAGYCSLCDTGADDGAKEEGVLDLSVRLTAGFAHRLHLGSLPAVFAIWRQLAMQAKMRM